MMPNAELPSTIKFGAYIFVKELGRGGEGVVGLYQGRDDKK